MSARRAVRPSSALRNANKRSLHVRLNCAVETLRRRDDQRRAIDDALAEVGLSPIAAPPPPAILPGTAPAQFAAYDSARLARSAKLVAAAIAHLRSTGCAPSRRAIVSASRLPIVDPSGVGISLSVLERGEARRLYLDAKQGGTAARKMPELPAWAARLHKRELIELVLEAEAAVRTLTSAVMASGERLLQVENAIRRRAAVDALKSNLDRQA
jgi:hypothetical protein